VIRDAYREVIDVQLRLIEAKSDVDGLKERNADISRLLDEEKQKIASIATEIDQLKQRALSVKDATAQFLMDNEDRRDTLNEMARGKTEEEVHNEIEAEKAKLHFVQGAAPGAIKEFETRAKEIERLQRAQEARDGEMAQSNAKLEKIKREWEPQLDDLVSRIDAAFSFNFEQINCAGEVDVHKDEDFDKWAIDIKVRFRYAVLFFTHLSCLRSLRIPNL
jgi:structural maintenance of chromosomes protein 5